MTTVSAIRPDSSCPLVCLDERCGRTFGEPDAFFKHWGQHQQCPFPSCVKPIISKFDLERHCKRIHKDYFPEFRNVEKMACKHQCGRLYAGVDISNLRRHEETEACLRNQTLRPSRQPRQPRGSTVGTNIVNDGAGPTTAQSSHHDNTSQTLHHLVHSPQSNNSQPIPPPDPVISPQSHNLHTSRIRIRDDGSVLDIVPVIQAIELLKPFFTDGPVSDALQSLKTTLDSLGSSFSPLDVLDGPWEEMTIGQSDNIVELFDIQQHGPQSSIHDSVFNDEGTATLPPIKSKRRIDREDTDLSRVPPKRHKLMNARDSNRKSTTFGNPEIVDITSSNGYESEVDMPSGVDMPFQMVQLASQIISILMDHNDLRVRSSQSLLLEAIPSSALQSLHPKACALAVLFVDEFIVRAKVIDPQYSADDRRRAIAIALMLAQLLYERQDLPKEFWAQAICMPVARTMKIADDFRRSLYTHLPFSLKWGMPEVFERLDRFFLHSDQSLSPSL